MGIFDFFKKKEEPPSFDPNIAPMDNLGKDMTGLGGTLQQDFPPLEQSSPNNFANNTFPGQNTFPANTYAPNREPQNDLLSKNIEIISYKIDALKASLDSMNQRLANLEAMARGEQQKYRW
jgi:hypothetical protein